MHVLLGSLSVLTAIYLFTLLSHFFVSNRRLCRLLAFISLRIPWVKVVPKARAIAGMLTFTIEVSRLAMKMPTATMAKASHLFRWASMNRSVSPAGSFCSNFILLFPSAPLSFLLMQNHETNLAMGVQGARPHAGGTGVSPENLPFFCTKEIFGGHPRSPGM